MMAMSSSKQAPHLLVMPSLALSVVEVWSQAVMPLFSASCELLMPCRRLKIRQTKMMQLKKTKSYLLLSLSSSTKTTI